MKKRVLPRPLRAETRVKYKQRTMDRFERLRLLARPLTRETENRIAADISGLREDFNKMKSDIETVVDAVDATLRNGETQDRRIAELEKKVAEMQQRQATPPTVVIAKKPQKCTICGREGHNARNAKFHPPQVVHVPGGLTVAHV